MRGPKPLQLVLGVGSIAPSLLLCAWFVCLVGFVSLFVCFIVTEPLCKNSVCLMDNMF